MLVALGAIVAVLAAAPVLHLGSSAPPGSTALDMWIVLPVDLVAFEALKMVAALLASWLLVVSLISVVLFERGREAAGDAVLLWVPGFLRRVVRAGVSVAVAGTMVASSVSSSAATEAADDIDLRDVAVLVHLGPVEAPISSAPPAEGDADSPTSPVTGVPIHQDSSQEPDEEVNEASSPEAVPELGQVRDSTGEWVVRPGEHFWSIAEEILTREHGVAPTDAEIGPYWLDLIEANQERLPDPANPDLIYPGMRLTISPRT